MNEYALDGYLIRETDVAINIWDADELIGTLLPGTSDAVLLAWISGHKTGHKRGVAFGRRLLQHDLREILGVKRDE